MDKFFPFISLKIKYQFIFNGAGSASGRGGPTAKVPEPVKKISFPASMLVKKRSVDSQERRSNESTDRSPIVLRSKAKTINPENGEEQGAEVASGELADIQAPVLRRGASAVETRGNDMAFGVSQINPSKK
eukprot:TRINITY_DN29355_c0_g1_i1.p1 TRINITY_DN29355_c0_g1~~TRINITY_DN29355_c0_g1_i1.p1  ORF type:complete len:131 (-),score=16.69 TRINITY_DN29355_c0_g1_i1:192-584(-)